MTRFNIIVNRRVKLYDTERRAFSLRQLSFVYFFLLTVCDAMSSQTTYKLKITKIIKQR